MISLLLSVALVFSAPASYYRGVASWYGSTAPRSCHAGLPRTCSPYLSGERIMYAAVGSFRWSDDPYKVKVCRSDNVRVCVVVVVRDYCERCYKDSRKAWTNSTRVIDLSPAAFAQLAPLHHGLVRVVVLAYGGR